MKKILLLLAEGFETYEASVFIDVMGWNRIEGDGSTILESCGFSKEVKTSFGQKAVADYLVDEIKAGDYDALAIPVGFEEFGFYEQAYDEKFLSLIREFHAQDKPIAAVCVAALPVGKSGILKGKKGTTYNQNPIRQKALRDFGVKVLQQPLVETGKIITSWNPSTAMPVAYRLLEMLTSKQNADKVRILMGFQ